MERTNRVRKRRKPFFYFFIVLFYISNLQAQLTIGSWNIRDFGKSKTDENLQKIALIIADFDVIAIQEVVASNEGAKAVSKLVDILNRKNNQWDYVISNPTTGSPHKSERYAYVWKKKKIKIKTKAKLATEYQNNIEREPFLFFFEYKTKNYTLVNIHAASKKDQPEKEIKYLKKFSDTYKGHLIFLGDFNLKGSHIVFNPLKKMGYKTSLDNQKTTLKDRCINNDCLANSYDHFFYQTKQVNVVKSGVVHFYTSFNTLKEAKKISDHLPIYIQIL